MVLLIDSINAIRDFLDTGGQVLLVIGVLIFAMWLLILERFIYFFKGFRSYKQNVKAQWKSRAERNSWNAEQIRQAMISRASMRLDTNLALINVMVALCPLLGLLGTVTGMIEVYDVMEITGTGSARSLWHQVFLKQLFQPWQVWLAHFRVYLTLRFYCAEPSAKLNYLKTAWF